VDSNLFGPAKIAFIARAIERTANYFPGHEARELYEPLDPDDGEEKRAFFIGEG